MKLAIVLLFSVLISNFAHAEDCASVVLNDVKESFTTRATSVLSGPIIAEISKADAVALTKPVDEKVFRGYYSNFLASASAEERVYKVNVTTQSRSVGPDGHLVVEEYQLVTLRYKDCSRNFMLSVGSTLK